MINNLLIVFVSCPAKEADSLAETIVTEKLAACVNIFPVNSVYIWENKLCKDDEALLIMKSTQAAYAKLETRIKQLHSYDVPEIIAIKVEATQADYLNWVHEQTIKS